MSVPNQTSKWSLPPPVNGQTWGYQFVGDQPCTEDDFADLKAQAGTDDYDVDALTLVGCFSPDWTSMYHDAIGAPASARPGGKGSPTYETQKVGTGVSFWLEEDGPGFYYLDGKKTHGIPPNCGAYHQRGTMRFAGPQPGSAAEELLGSGVYQWDDENARYEIVKPEADGEDDG